MNATSTSTGKELAAELNSLSRHAFQNKCHEILIQIFPFLVNAYELGVVDQMGVDLYSLASNDRDFELVFQCKGHEVSEFMPRHLKDCLSSISDFKKSNRKAANYYFVINKHIPDRSMRNELQDALDDLVASGNAGQAILLDLNRTINFFFSSTREILISKINLSNQRFFDDYRTRLDQTFYQESVPFVKLPNIGNELSNPIAMALKSTLAYTGSLSSKGDGTISQCAKNKWFFVISEFGFGKTSLLLNVVGKLFAHGITPVYLPIAQFDRDSFSNEKSVCKKILEIILEEQLDEARYIDKIMLKDFQLLMRSTGKYSLLFDGLDEHEHAYSNDGLKRIFQCINDFSNKCLFAVRKEFWDDRRCTFEDAIGPKRDSMDFIELREWHDSDIEAYLRNYIVSNELGQEETELVNDFRSVVEAGSYHEYYGDIPKRPLFLKMITDDIARGEMRRKNLSQIYQTYLIAKLKLDRHTSVTAKSSGRPLSVRGDVIKQAERIFDILAEAARAMLVNDENCNIHFVSNMLESDLETIIESLKVTVDETIEILVNSVLVPFDRRSLYDFKVKFAHKSFQEYFTAHYMVELLCNPAGTQQEYDLFNFNFSDGVVTFMKGMLEERKTDRNKSEMCFSMISSLHKSKSESSTSLISKLFWEIA